MTVVQRQRQQTDGRVHAEGGARSRKRPASEGGSALAGDTEAAGDGGGQREEEDQRMSDGDAGTVVSTSATPHLRSEGGVAPADVVSEVELLVDCRLAVGRLFL